VSGDLGVTLLVALGTALVLGALAQRLRMTPLVGYIVAGLAVGPFTPGFVADRDQIFDLADIGVALLMFSIGLRFPLHQIAAVGRLVLVGAVIQVAVMGVIGLGVGTAFGLSWLESLFIGAIVSNSSSVVIVKVAGDAVVEGTLHGRIALGWSTIQDVTTVGIVVILTSLSGDDGGNAVLDVGGATVLAILFIGAVILGGSRVYPVILGSLARVGSREIFIIGVAVLAIGTAFAATFVGISIALGAFVAGIALADSDLTESVLGEIVPLRELFAAFFFVSIGLLIDPGIVLAQPPLLLAVLALIIPIKGTLTAAICRIGGHAWSTSMRVGALLAQNGEFSFVLAVIGLELGVVSETNFSLLMAAVVASIVLSGGVVRGTDLAASALGGREGKRVQSAETQPTALRRHAVVLGYGRVGRTVVRALRNRGFPHVVIDADYQLVERATRAGEPITFGEAGSRSILDSAGVARALMLIVAIPDALATRQAVDYALQANPRIDIVARAHSDREEAYLRRRGVRRVVVAEREIGHELMRHALHRFGVTEREIEAMHDRRD
jgi:monovalent cation:H+ antiporter-2, CPA2 family